MQAFRGVCIGIVLGEPTMVEWVIPAKINQMQFRRVDVEIGLVLLNRTPQSKVITKSYI